MEALMMGGVVLAGLAATLPLGAPAAWSFRWPNILL
jgi:hypothetical protein